ncbi:hypothetical protein DFH07DRAFT_782476 [Mycena maculata]|uniref:Uncharacterized protein n=1 Tax=Mycena maculata TaxID=230809 RepID=A0AAD7HSL1_9AGAR|nr:hypothetical protein DFH07DRAFT_782476 [Mycena maculata]
MVFWQGNFHPEIMEARFIAHTGLLIGPARTVPTHQKMPSGGIEGGPSIDAKFGTIGTYSGAEPPRPRWTAAKLEIFPVGEGQPYGLQERAGVLRAPALRLGPHSEFGAKALKNSVERAGSLLDVGSFTVSSHFYGYFQLREVYVELRFWKEQEPVTTIG